MRPTSPPSGQGSSQPQPRSILRRNTVLGTRQRSDGETTDSDNSERSPSSPTKRRKVVFQLSDNVVVEIGKRTLDEVKREVKKALHEHELGDNEGYDTLKGLFADGKKGGGSRNGEDERRTDHVETPELRAYVLALTICAPLLGKSCNGLVRAVLHCQWLGRSEAFVKTYIQFLASLASAQGNYLTTVLAMLVDKFEQSRVSEWEAPRCPEVDRVTARARLHTALKYLIRTFPAATVILNNLVGTKYPGQDESKRVHKAYVDNLLRLREYATDIRTEIMDLIVNQVVKIDSQMQLDLDDLDDDTTTQVLLSLQRQSGTGESGDGENDSDISDDESIQSDDEEDEEQRRVEEMRKSVQKMDSTLDTLFELYTPFFAEPESDQAFSHYETLMGEFTNIILPTYKSRHTQFLVFHFGQLSPRLMDAFCGTCINLAFESNRPTILRQAAISYLASFVSRGVRVPGDMVRTVFDLLGYHMNDMRMNFEAGCRGPDLQRYGAYYSLVQALLYMFCFRWRDLVANTPDTVDHEDLSSYIGHDLEWVAGIKETFSQNIYSKLNPLKVCAPTIVEEFARLANHLRFLYVYPLLETNKRIKLSQFVSSTYGVGGSLRDSGVETRNEDWHRLDSYFPFDPYQLPVSKRWIEADYMPWTGIPGLSQDSDESGDESEDDDHSEDDVDEAHDEARDEEHDENSGEDENVGPEGHN